jgi:predicted nucleic acid-binding protein
MSDSKELVLDANVMLRGVLGEAVSSLLDRFSNSVDLYIPDIALADARRHIPLRAARLQIDPAKLFIKLDQLEALVHVVHRVDYEVHEFGATNRIRRRDISDWPMVATCLLLNAPLWTEDRDFFGCGLATWTTNNVAIYLTGD